MVVDMTGPQTYAALNFVSTVEVIDAHTGIVSAQSRSVLVPPHITCPVYGAKLSATAVKIRRTKSRATGRRPCRDRPPAGETVAADLVRAWPL